MKNNETLTASSDAVIETTTLTRELKSSARYAGRSVNITSAPASPEAAVKMFGGLDRLAFYAIEYVIAHSLLAKARKLAEDAPDGSEPIELPFTVPSKEARSGAAIRIDASKLTPEALAATVAALRASNVEFKIVGLKG